MPPAPPGSTASSAGAAASPPPHDSGRPAAPSPTDLDPMAPSTLPLRQRLQVLGLSVYCAAVVAIGLPRELAPSSLTRHTYAVRDLLSEVGINPWHEVFPGQRNHEKRRHIALRFVGETVDGTPVVLHESPSGLRHPSFRFFDNIRDTVSFKVLKLVPLSRMMRVKGDIRWRRQLENFRSLPQVINYTASFCLSDTLGAGHDLRWVEMEVYAAGIDYDDGEQYGRATRVIRVDCTVEAYGPVRGSPSTLPDWPGVAWRDLP